MTKIFSLKNIQLQKCLRFLIMLVTLLLTISVSAAAQPTLDWELVNSFPFIRDLNTFYKLRDAYARINVKSAEALESEMQRLSDLRVDEIRNKAKSCENLKGKKKKECIAESKPPYLGWIRDLAVNHHFGTCWDSQKLKFRNEEIAQIEWGENVRKVPGYSSCKNYINPQSYKVRIKINNSQALAGVPLSWYINNQQLKPNHYTECYGTYKFYLSAERRKDVCIEISDIPGDKRVIISVAKEDGSDLGIEPIPVEIKDKLIVGLGDSYASGEGNPDIPAEFSYDKTDHDFYKFKLERRPQKDKRADAIWLDTRCHRSMYSYQFKTALQLALSNPKETVTFVSLACSGAVTKNIIDTRQKAQEKIVSGKIKDRKRVRPQIEALREILTECEKDNSQKCEIKRGIDYLLLSTGGNDIGFADYVKHILLSGTILKKVGKKPNKDTLVDIPRLMNSYKNLKDKLLKGYTEEEITTGKALKGDFSKGIPINGCKPTEEECNRILLTPYPDVINDENGKLCKANRCEFWIPFGEDSARAEKIELIKKSVFEPLKIVQDNSESTLKWKVVRGHLDKYLRHGFCAQDRRNCLVNGEKRCSLDGEKNCLDIEEIFVMPTRKNNVWTSFDPRDYKAYESRKRWVRLPVDSKLTSDQRWRIWRFNIDFKFLDDTSSVMHPTAEGLSVTADANLCEIQKLENLPCNNGYQ